METLYYSTFSSHFGKFTIIWKENDSSIFIQRIFLSDQNKNSDKKATEYSTQIKNKSNSIINSAGKQIQLFLNGEEVEFNLQLLDFSRCFDIQKKVLLAEHGIPRGFVSTYQRIANHIGLINGARVVGNSLAKNPFPIFIPCHRAIRSDGNLGGYQGGLDMKCALLEMEGVKISEKGKVVTDKIYY